MGLPPLWETFNLLSEKAANYLGVSNESVPFNMGCAATGAIVVAGLLSEIILRSTPETYQEYLPRFFKTMEKLTLAAPVIYAVLDPHAKEYAQNNPVYMYGVGTGILTASQVFSVYSHRAKNKVIRIGEQKYIDSLFKE